MVDSGAGGKEALQAAPLSIRQPEKGYRFSIDSVLLAGFAAPFCRGSVLDLGTGCGVLLLLLSRLSGEMSFGVGVELQEELFECARDNFLSNGPEGALNAFHGDFRKMPHEIVPGAFDLVVSNPPYVRVGDGRRNPDSGKEAARHEVHSSLEELFSAAIRFMAPRGRFALILPVERIRDIEACRQRERMSMKVTRLVFPWEDKPPSRVLCCLARESCGSTEELPSLVLHAEKEKYCSEVEKICRLFRSGVQSF
ncbi:MAG: methyltransferase [Syntrophorhabdaceae bacterium]|nr:methyltransferase [Syntrophorhabdaceae bacterium]